MNYLFFDIECCDGRHVCEFGYVVVDETFGVVERDCLTINPEVDFDLGAMRRGGRGVELAFRRRDYLRSPNFEFYYERIKRLLTAKDCVVVGFSLMNDAGFLARAYERYGLEPIAFKYYDFQKLYRGYTGAKTMTSVGGVVQELGIDDVRLHKSDDDAWAVARALQVASAREGLTLAQTLDKLARVCRYEPEFTAGVALTYEDRLRAGRAEPQKDFLWKFLCRKKPAKVGREDVFFGKSVCVSSHFQKKRFNELLAIIERLYDYGATFTTKPAECDIFIDYRDGDVEEPRLERVKSAAAESCRNVLILSLTDALAALNLTEKELNEVDRIALYLPKFEKRSPSTPRSDKSRSSDTFARPRK